MLTATPKMAVLLRTSMDMISQLFAKQQPAAVLLYKDFTSKIF
jgi:hypothetical protein